MHDTSYNLYEGSTKTVSQALVLHYSHVCNPLLFSVVIVCFVCYCCSMLLCPSELLALAASVARSQRSHLWVSQMRFLSSGGATHH